MIRPVLFASHPSDQLADHITNYMSRSQHPVTRARDNSWQPFIDCIFVILVTGEIPQVDPSPRAPCLMCGWHVVWPSHVGGGWCCSAGEIKQRWLRNTKQTPCAVKHKTLHLAPPLRVINWPLSSPHQVQITWVSPHLPILMTLSVLSHPGLLVWFMFHI